MEKGSVLGSADLHADLGAVRLRLSLLHRLYINYTFVTHLLYTKRTAMATNQKRITFKLPDIEYERIQALSERTGRTMTDILREFIRSLPEPEAESKPEKKPQKK